MRGARVGGFAVAIAALMLAPTAVPARGGDVEDPVTLDDAPTVYVCPMHPEVTSDKPGRCPKCHMQLEPRPKRPSP